MELNYFRNIVIKYYLLRLNYKIEFELGPTNGTGDA